MRDKGEILQNDQRIPDRLKNGFERIYKEHLQVLCIAAYKIVRDKEKAKDCVQDLFMELWDGNKISRLLEMEDAGAYLFTCVRHKCYRLLSLENRQGKVNDLLSGLQQDTPVLPEKEEDPRKTAVLMDAVQNMPPQPYKAFQLHVIEGKKEKK
ncbi:hypothetical protein A8C56_06070 [Niabella ginsenosidivorans]|uniref:RNA polymerase sigma-70 region 2 domain-containing protein n=1 Tax=Niabella ginsenosidivorans TaxID=1176587 RepID=A0A1A9HZU9_9BACT|nr:sigma-70 family RNA polymerase sigma factor [Niabella ginsenosidivorans]ANH80605.1 hypothetical protein A8C56_06070 [Niabella ginsenosidivorans]